MSQRHLVFHTLLAAIVGGVLAVAAVAWASQFPLTKPSSAQQSNLWARVVDPSSPLTGDTIELVADGEGHLYTDSTSVVVLPDGGFPVFFPDGGTITANQGTPGASAWPVSDAVADANLPSIATSTAATSLLLALITPAQNAATVTPSDGADLPHACKAVALGSAGNITVNMTGSGTAIQYAGQLPGVLPIQITRVYSTGTSATGIVCLY
jgi:hypothetical protein